MDKLAQLCAFHLMKSRGGREHYMLFLLKFIKLVTKLTEGETIQLAEIITKAARGDGEG